VRTWPASTWMRPPTTCLWVHGLEKPRSWRRRSTPWRSMELQWPMPLPAQYGGDDELCSAAFCICLIAWSLVLISQPLSFLLPLWLDTRLLLLHSFFFQGWEIILVNQTHISNGKDLQAVSCAHENTVGSHFQMKRITGLPTHALMMILKREYNTVVTTADVSWW
jgi:hypothetical protein